MRVSLPREGECARELGLRESLFKRVQRGCIHNAITKIVPLRYSPRVVGVFNNQSVFSSAVTEGVAAKVIEQGCGTHSSLLPGLVIDNPSGPSVYALKGVYIRLLIGVPRARAVFQFRAY